MATTQDTTLDIGRFIDAAFDLLLTTDDTLRHARLSAGQYESLDKANADFRRIARETGVMQHRHQRTTDPDPAFEAWHDALTAQQMAEVE